MGWARGIREPGRETHLPPDLNWASPDLTNLKQHKTNRFSLKLLEVTRLRQLIHQKTRLKAAPRLVRHL